MHIGTRLNTTLYAAAVFFVCASYENFAAISGYLSPTTYTAGAAQIIDWAQPDPSYLVGRQDAYGKKAVICPMQHQKWTDQDAFGEELWKRVWYRNAQQQCREMHSPYSSGIHLPSTAYPPWSAQLKRPRHSPAPSFMHHVRTLLQVSP